MIEVAAVVLCVVNESDIWPLHDTVLDGWQVSRIEK